MINYIEKGYGLHEAIRAAGYHLEEANGVWISDNDAAVQAIIDSYVIPKEPIPDASPRQMRQALILSGVSLAGIENAISAMPEPAQSLARVEWEYATTFERSNHLVGQIGAAMGWSDSQLDDLWLLAGTL